MTNEDSETTLLQHLPPMITTTTTPETKVTITPEAKATTPEAKVATTPAAKVATTPEAKAAITPETIPVVMLAMKQRLMIAVAMLNRYKLNSKKAG
jgi:hypothetical protein